MYLIIFYISLYLSLAGFINRAGFSLAFGLIPVLNIYIFFKIIGVNPIFLLLSVGLLYFPEARMAVITIFTIFLPFLIADAYDKNLLYGVLGLILPFIILPYIAYIKGDYCYEGV